MKYSCSIQILEKIGEEGTFGKLSWKLCNHKVSTRRSKRFIWKFFFKELRWITCFSIRRVGVFKVPIWQSWNHKIIRLHDVFVEDSSLCLVMDLMVSDLSRVIESASHPLPSNRIKC